MNMKKTAALTLTATCIGLLVTSACLRADGKKQPENADCDVVPYHCCQSCASPAVGGGLALFAGSHGYLHAVDLATGEQRWEIDSIEIDSIAEGSSPRELVFPYIADDAAYFALDAGVYAIDMKTGQVRWTFKAEAASTGITFLSDGGKLYYGAGLLDGSYTDGSYAHGSVYALDIKTGQERWNTILEGTALPLAIVDGVVIFAGRGTLQAFDTETGGEKWKIKVRGKAAYSTSIYEGVVYVENDDGYLCALDARTGGEKWRIKPEIGSLCVPKADASGVYFASGPYLYAVDNRTGRERWKYKMEGKAVSRAVVADDLVCFQSHGNVSEGDHTDYIHALELKTGKERWRFKTQGIDFDFAVAEGGVYFGTGSQLHGLDLQTGNEKWVFRTEGKDYLTSSPTINNGVVCFATEDAESGWFVEGPGVGDNLESLYAVDAGTGQKRWKLTEKRRPKPPEPPRVVPISERISESQAKRMLAGRAREVLLAIKNRDGAKLATYVHPRKGVRFSLYGYISLEGDRVFTRNRVKGLFSDRRRYVWGCADGSGDPIRLTARQYIKCCVYDRDFLRVKVIGYNKVILGGDATSNISEVYPDAIPVTYHFPGSDPSAHWRRYGSDPGWRGQGFGWRSLCLAFEKKNRTWYLIGVITIEQTI